MNDFAKGIASVCLAAIGLLSGCNSAPKNSAPGGSGTPTPRYGYSEVFNRRPATNPSEWSLQPISQFNPELAIHPLEPLTVILSRVYVPRPKRLDGGNIAVVLTIETGDGQSQQLVVSYQTGLNAGQPLNLQDLTVYSIPAWDGRTAPYFRVEVWDIYDPKDDDISKSLQDAEDVVRSLGGLFPTSLAPMVESVVRATRFILDSQRGNTPLVDHRIQFHGPNTGGKERGGSATAVLQEGTWVLLGRPPEEASNRRYFDVVAGMDHDRPIVFDANRQPLEIPTVVLTISKEDQRVPSNVLNDAKAFATAISDAKARSEPSSLTPAINELAVSVDVYKAYRAIVDGPSTTGFRQAINWLLDTQALSESNQRLLVSAVRRYTNETFTTKSQVAEWWESAKNGHLDQRTQKWVNP